MVRAVDSTTGQERLRQVETSDLGDSILDCLSGRYLADDTLTTPALAVWPAAGTWFGMFFDIEDVCGGDAVSHTTGSPWSFTATRSGVHLFEALVDVDLAATWAAAKVGLGLFVNGTLVSLLDRRDAPAVASGVDPLVVTGSDLVFLDVDDVVDIRLNQTNGGAQPNSPRYAGRVAYHYEGPGTCSECS